MRSLGQIINICRNFRDLIKEILFLSFVHKKDHQTPLFESHNKKVQGIIEGDQITVAAFSLEYFSYFTGLTLGQ